MKRLISIALFAACIFGMQSQILHQGFLNGYNVGETLERHVYTEKKESGKLNTWAGAFSSKPNEMPSPKVTDGLTFSGYNESGCAIQLGMPDGMKGKRFSTYTMTEGKEFSKGVLYLSCLIKIDKIGVKTPHDILGLSPNVTGGSNRASILVRRSAESSKILHIGCSLQKDNGEIGKTFELGKTYLVVLKLDYVNQCSAIWVNPNLSAGETEPDLVVNNSAENPVKSAIRGISLRNRNGLEGSIGGLRLTRDWASISE